MVDGAVIMTDSDLSFFRRRTPDQQRADERFSQACDALSAALEAERNSPTAECRKLRREAEKAWEECRKARDRARKAAL
jgi:hypothetical protein